MKTLLRPFLLLFLPLPASLHAQNTNLVLDGTTGTNVFTNNISASALNLSLGFFADYLVVAGGGSGGTPSGPVGQQTWSSGGGGAGGMLTGSTQLSATNYGVTVGAGGNAPSYNNPQTIRGNNGSNSVFGSFTAIGGGGGAGGENDGFSGVGANGGSGGGGGSKFDNPGGSGTAGQGFNGGSARAGDTGNANNRTAGGGGGGAGAAGSNGSGGGNSDSVGGNGGAGKASDITGASVMYAGGGGGGARDIFSGQQGGSGGSGGGGAGSTTGSAGNGVNGLGGGGGGRGADGVGGNGGSGVVIVRYQGASLGNIGGTVTSGTGTASGYTLHTFTNTGSANFDMSGVNLNDRLGATVSGNITANDMTSSGPGTVTLAGSNRVTFDSSVNGGTLRLTGTLHNRLAYVATQAGSTAAVVIDGGTWANTNAAIELFGIGTAGQGSLTINSGTVMSRAAYVGYSTSFFGAPGGTGVVNMTGGSWLATNSGISIMVGGDGSGTINLSGGQISTTSISLGNSSNAVAVVNAVGGTLSTSYLYLERSGGQATLNISNGGTVETVTGFNLRSTNAALNLGPGGTLRIGTTNQTFFSELRAIEGFDVGGSLQFVGNSNKVFAPLRIGDGGTNGVLAGNFQTTSSVTFNRAGESTYTGNFSGTGSLIKEGVGTVTLAGSNTFRGDAVVNNGTLLLGSSTALGSGAVVKVNAGGTLEAGQSVVIGYLDLNGGTVIGSNNLVSALTLVNSGNVSGLANGTNFNAGILKRTAGTAVIDGANTFTGVIRAEAGTIQMTNGGSFAAASSLLLSNTASLDLNGISQEFSSVNGAGNIALGSGTLTVGGSEDSAFSGGITGTGGVVKSGAGIMTLSGTSTYSGATTVSGGELTVDGEAESTIVTVNDGATLSGSGSVGGLIVNLGGTINPGNSPGTQSVTGNVVWNAGGNYNWQIHDATGTAGSPTGWDLISATGQLDLSALTVGSEFNINLWSLSQVAADVNGEAINFDPTQNYTWTVLTTTGGILGYTGSNQFTINTGGVNGTGGFANLLDNGTFSMVQSGNDLNLVFTAAGGEPIPEPGTWAAAALLAGGAAYMRWRRRK